MKIRFYCPQCNTPLEAPAEYAGRKSKCLKCEHEATIPQRSEQPPPVAVLVPPPRQPEPRNHWNDVGGVLLASTLACSLAALCSPFAAALGVALSAASLAAYSRALRSSTQILFSVVCALALIWCGVVLVAMSVLGLNLLLRPPP